VSIYSVVVFASGGNRLAQMTLFIKLLLETKNKNSTIKESNPLTKSPRGVRLHVSSCKVLEMLDHFKTHILAHINLPNHIFTGEVAKRRKE